MPSESLELSRYLPYLLNRAGVNLANLLGAAVRMHGITLPIWRVLAALGQKDGLLVGQLAEITAIEVSTLSRVLDLMQGKDLVERRRPAGDARTVSVHLTAAGSELLKRMLPSARRCEALALQDFTAEEAELLRNLLARLHRNLQGLQASEQLRAVG